MKRDCVVCVLCYVCVCDVFVFCTSACVYLCVCLCGQSKENRTMNDRLNGLESSHAIESERLRKEVGRLRTAEEEAKNNANRVTSLLEELARLRQELQTTQKEKKVIEDWAETYRDEMEQVPQRSRTSVHLL